MKNGAVILDEWELPIFEKHLKEAGFSYTVGPVITWGPLKDTLTVKVDYESVDDLQPVIEKANKEAALKRAH